MSDDKTDPQSPYALAVEVVVCRQLEGFEERLLDKLGKLVELSELRIASAVEKRLDRRLKELGLAQKTTEARLVEHERRIGNIEEIVRGEAFQRVLRFAYASMPPEPIPDTERGQ